MDEPLEFLPEGSETKEAAQDDIERNFVFAPPECIVEKTGQWFQDCHILNDLGQASSEPSNSTKDNVFVRTNATA